MSNLGVLYYEGYKNIIPKSKELGLQYIKKAADH